MLEVIGGRAAGALVTATALVAQVAGDCFGCDSEKGNTASGPPAPPLVIEGPETITAGKPVTFSVLNQGLGSKACPESAYFTILDPKGEARQEFTTLPKGTDAKGNCITSITMPHTFAQGDKGSTREVLLQAQLNGTSFNFNGGTRKVKVQTLSTGSTPAAPAPAPASSTAPRAEDFRLFGSNLQGPADAVESHQQDSVYWNVELAGGGVPLAPLDGQVAEIRLKGSMLPKPDGTPPLHPGDPDLRVQVLKRDGDGVWRVPPGGGTSAPFRIPVGDFPEHVTTFRPENLCIAKGDAVAINSVGGWDGTGPSQGGYHDGIPWKVFSARDGSTTNHFHKHDATNNGARLENGFGDDNEPVAGPVSRPGQEMLLQVVLATGNARSYECGGPNTYRPK